MAAPSAADGGSARSRAANIIKLACIHDNQFPVLLEFDQNAPLAQIITNLCAQWKVDNPDSYSFKSDDTQMYITEKNRHTLRDGAVLKLALSPGSLAGRHVANLNGRDPSLKMQALKELLPECKDATFANKFAAQGGVSAITKVITEFLKAHEPTNLGFAMSVYGELMGHKLIDAESLPEDFVNKMVSSAGSDNPTLARAGLKVASVYLRTASKGFALVTAALPVQLILNVAAGASDAGIHEGCLAVINGIIQCGPPVHLHAMYQSLEQCHAIESFKQRVASALQSYRATAESDAASATGEPRPCFEDSWAHELAVFQQLWLNRLYDDSLTPYSAENEPDLQTLKRNLPEAEDDKGARRKGADADHAVWARLGFENPDNPTSQFMDPPGVLSLKCMAYFARANKDIFEKLVLDQLSRNEYACPITQASVALVSTMIDLFRIGQPPQDQVTEFMPLFFSCLEPFREIYCVGIQLVCKTWREMEAKRTDFQKVINIVRKQLEYVLCVRPERQPRSCEELKTAVFGTTYSEMQRIEQEETQRRQNALEESEPVRLLREKLKRELMELVKQQKISKMTKGAWFNAVVKGKVKKDMHFFAALSPNSKTFHWDDPVTGPPEGQPSIHQLKNHCEVHTLKELYVGNDVQSIAAKKKLEEPQAGLVFSIVGDSFPDGLEFSALDRSQAAVWIDGVRVLLGRNIDEPESLEDLSHLLSLEMKLRLLNLHGVRVHELSPSVPSLPADFDFVEEQVDSNA